MWALLRCFYSPSFPTTLPLLFSLYLWAVKWGGQRRGRRENNCRRKRSVIELSWDPALRQACVGLGGRANRMCRKDTHTHTHRHTNKLTFFCLSHRCRAPDRSLWFQKHTCDCYPLWLLLHLLAFSARLYMCSLSVPLHMLPGMLPVKCYTPDQLDYFVHLLFCMWKDSLFAWLWPHSAITNHVWIMAIIHEANLVVLQLSLHPHVFGIIIQLYTKLRKKNEMINYI